VSALNEERTVLGVLREALRCPGVDRVFLVVNGSRDRTADYARWAAASDPRITVREEPEPLGHDVGRSVAAEWALAEGAGGLLFVDADFVVPAGDLAPFVRALEEGVDVALNGLTRLLEGWPSRGPVTSAQTALNAFLGRPDLGLDGLVAVPHALSRRAVETVGPAALSVPPVAHALAVMSGLEVRVVHTVDVITPNRPSKDRPRARRREEMVELLLGDHIEAVAALIARRGPRGGFPGHGRRRPGPHPRGPSPSSLGRSRLSEHAPDGKH
jgi:glycosyltransferase involved in cell wall biosynthesis